MPVDGAYLPFPLVPLNCCYLRGPATAGDEEQSEMTALVGEGGACRDAVPGGMLGWNVMRTPAELRTFTTSRVITPRRAEVLDH